MIVVAIIGILAAVAIPGFMKYIKDSKTTEAKTNLKAIAEGASSFFQTEHSTSKAGDEFFTHQYPSADFCKAKAAGGECKGTADSHTDIQATGSKSAGSFGGEPWASLNVAISGPVYYMYSYKGVKGDGDKGSTFDLQAAAKLDKPKDVDSCFTIAGTVNTEGDPTFGAIIDLSEDASKCKKFGS